MTGRRRLVRSTGILADKKTAANVEAAVDPVVPDSAVEKAAKALHDHRHPTFDWDSAAEYMTKVSWRQQAQVALAAALPDLIAANTDDTKADAQAQAAAERYRDAQAQPFASDENSDTAALTWLISEVEALCQDAEQPRIASMLGAGQVSARELRAALDRAAALRTDTTHKDQP